MARQTWSFFDTFVTPNKTCCADNFQEIRGGDREPHLSTNIGLYLLSVASAVNSAG